MEGQEAEEFAARGIAVVEGEIEEVVAADGQLAGLRLTGGKHIALDAFFTIPSFLAADGLLAALGAETTDGPTGTLVRGDETGRTSIGGVWAAGNVVNPAANDPVPVGAGARAGAAINYDLVLEGIALARSGNGGDATAGR